MDSAKAVKVTKLDLEAMVKIKNDDWFTPGHPYPPALRCHRLVKLGMLEDKRIEHNGNGYTYYTAKYKRANTAIASVE